MAYLPYLNSYSSDVHAQVIHLISEGTLGEYLKRTDPQAHCIQTDKALFTYTQDLKRTFLKSSPPLSKVCFDARLHAVHHALGTHTQIARVQGKKLKSKREIRIDARFKNAPLSLLKMIVVHEVAHLKEKDHTKAFYTLCVHMEPRYHQLEFEARLFLLFLDRGESHLILKTWLILRLSQMISF